MVELRDGTWQVAEAGLVTFTVERETLVLHDIEPAHGWNCNVVAEQADRLEVEFCLGRDVRALQARYASGVLTVEIDSESGDARPGRYCVGDAGEVEIAIDGGELRLIEVATNPGWSMEVDEESEREIEVGFRRGALEWGFDAGLSRRGRLGIDVEMELTGPYPA